MRTKVLLITALLLALPCAAGASDRKDAELALAEAGASVEAATRADAGEYASEDLIRARDMLASARDAYDHREWTDSWLASDNAKADANLAAARSRQHRAETTTAELERTVRSLRDQIGAAGGQP